MTLLKPCVFTFPKVDVAISKMQSTKIKTFKTTLLCRVKAWTLPDLTPPKDKNNLFRMVTAIFKSLM